MKKQVRILFISILIVITGIVFYIGILQKDRKEVILDRIPVSKPHSHVSVDGVIVKHTHTQITPPVVKPKTNDTDKVPTKHPILRAWENLDLAAIKRNYQPYTVPEMIAKWEEKYLTFEYPPHDKAAQHRLAQVEAYWPKEKWLQYLMDLGYPLHDASHYKMASDVRDQTLFIHKKAYDYPNTRVDDIAGFKLSADASWEEVEELNIKFNIVARLNVLHAKEIDPTVYGGVTNLNGVFTPFTPNTVQVHISENKSFSKFTGVMLSDQQKQDLTMYGIVPKGVTVVYTDKEGRPLPTDAKPRFYERKMAELAAAEAYIEQLITEHNALFKTLPAQPHKTVPQEQSTPSQETQQGDTRTHQSEGPALQENNRRPALPIDRHNIPPEMLPSEPPSHANIQEWFAMLQELHGGELPKDLRVLQEVMTELDAIRQAETDRIKQQRTSPPNSDKP